MINIEIILNSIIAISVPLLGVYLKHAENNRSKEISKLKEEMQKLVIFFDADKTMSEQKRKLNEIKTHYVEMFTLPEYSEAANIKGNYFVSVIEHILDTYEINFKHFNEIKAELDNGACLVRTKFSQALGDELTNLYYDEHIEKYEAYLCELESILCDTNNHYSDRFINLSISFLRDFMKHLKQMEKDYA